MFLKSAEVQHYIIKSKLTIILLAATPLIILNH